MSDWQGSSSSQQTTSGDHSVDADPGVEDPTVVCNLAGDVGGPPLPDFPPGRSDACGVRPSTSSSHPTGRVEYLRERYRSQALSGPATELLLSSSRVTCKTAKSYDALFQKWVGWCSEQHSDPFSGPVSQVVNFLAHLYQQGYQYRSLNAYRSAISSVHEKIDGIAASSF